MAIAGAGNPVGGSNPSGTGSSITYVGNHAYAYSGMAPSSSTSNLLDFVTGGEYIVADLTCYYGARGSGSDMQFKVKLNGQTIGQFNLTDSNDLTEFPVPFLIPPYSRFQVEESNLGGGTDDVAVSIVGRVYQ